jgi:hypothetical protein
MKLPKNFKITKDGKVEKRAPRKSVSQKIAEKKKPKRTYRAVR